MFKYIQIYNYPIFASIFILSDKIYATISLRNGWPYNYRLDTLSITAVNKRVSLLVFV